MAVEVEFLDAPDGIEATWYEAHGKLFIALATDLDEIARQRYITQAKREYGIEERRRRIAIPFILPGLRHGASQHKTAVAGIAVGIAAVAATAAVMVPAALDSNSTGARRPPAHAAAAPSGPVAGGGPSRIRPTSPEPTPSRISPSTPAKSQPTPAPSHASPRPRAGGDGKTLPSLEVPSTFPSLPVDIPPTSPPPITKPTVSVTIPPPGTRRRICIRIDLGIEARIGCWRS
jgi:hypothetical protein